MGGDLGPSMFIGSEAETEGAGDSDLPMKIISCHLFPRRKTGTNLLRGAIRPPPTPPTPPLELSGSAHACLDRNFIFHFLHVAGLAIILSRDNW